MRINCVIAKHCQQYERITSFGHNDQVDEKEVPHQTDTGRQKKRQHVGMCAESKYIRCVVRWNEDDRFRANMQVLSNTIGSVRKWDTLAAPAPLEP